MSVILVTTLSILAIAGIAFAVNRALHFRVCPICLGVGLTWLWMIAARFSGLAVDTTMLSILLGGSAVGVAYQLEKHLPQGRSALLWKTLFIPVAFIAAHGLATPDWPVLAAAIVALLLLTSLFFISPQKRANDPEAIEKLEQQMKKCC